MLKLVPIPIRHYARFFGRMTRSQFYRWLGFLLLAYIAAFYVDLLFIAPLLGYLPFEEVEEKYVTTITTVLLFLPWLTSNVRRLHDVNRTGWWMILAIPPLLIVYFSTDIGFWLYGFLADNSNSAWLSPAVSQLLTNWIPWITYGFAAILFLPVIYWSLKKGSNAPNRFGTRQ